MNTITTTKAHPAAASGRLRAVLGLFKLRIGVVIAFTAWAGLLVTPGQGPALWRSAAVVLAVLVSSAAAGAFNQYMEVDLDRRMGRTRRPPFLPGTLTHGRHRLWLIIALVMLAACAGPTPLPLLPPLALAPDRAVDIIAFGSCANQSKPQLIWNAVIASRPDLFIFLGDNIYGVTTDMAVLRSRYSLLGRNEGCQRLLATTPIIST